VISNIQDNQTNQKLSEKLKNILTLSLFASSRVSLVPATALGKNHQPPPGLFDDSGIQQSSMMITSLCELFPRFLSAVLALFLFSGNLFAGSANLAWNTSTSSNVGGYSVYYGQKSYSGLSSDPNYNPCPTNNTTYCINVVGNTTTNAVVTGLTEGTKYYFVVTAYDSAMTKQSAYSNEVSLTVPVTVPTALTADFTANKTSGNASLAVDFTPVTSGNITSWKWDFPGSQTPTITNSTAKVTTATYATAGTYGVSLTVSGSSPSVTTTKSNLITVTTPPPVANFSSTATSGIAPISIGFTDTSTGNITSRSWNFGDGGTSTAQNPTHTYSVAGTYTVSLTVTGAGGSVTKTNNGFINVSSSTVTPPVSETSKMGLVAAYGFEEVSGVTVADSSGMVNHGTIKEAVRITTGKYGKALKFDGVNDWVTVMDSASLRLTTGMTLEAWVKPSTVTSAWRDVIMKGNDNYYLMATTSNSGRPGVGGQFGATPRYGETFGTELLPTSTWTHLVATYDGAMLRQFVNGVQVSSLAQTGNILTSTDALRIGGDSFYGQFFQGFIDEVRIYNRALTATEILYNKATPISVSNPPKFVMGDQTLEPWVDYRTQGIAEAFQTVPQKSGVVSQLQVYLDASSTATEVVAGIYKDNNGHPGALVAKGKLSTLKTGAWNLIPIPVASVTAAQPYWIAILGSKGQIGFRDRLGSGTSLMETSASKTLTSLPANWTGSLFKTNSAMSVYGNGY
jgi:PKD repeat protein